MTPPKSTKPIEKQLSMQDSIIEMYKKHGWGERKCIEMAIKHCENMFLHDKENHWAYSTIETDWLRLKYYFETSLKVFDETKVVRITHYPLSHNKDEINSLISRDNKLIDAIIEKSNELNLKNIETFNQVVNVIVTEEGYYAATYSLKTSDVQVS